MIDEIQISVTEAAYHSPETRTAGRHAAEAIDATNERIREFNDSTTSLLDSDLSMIDPAHVFDGSARMLHYEILAQAVQARILFERFNALNVRESQNIVRASNGVSSELLTQANENVQPRIGVENSGKLSELRASLRAAVQRQVSL